MPDWVAYVQDTAGTTRDVGSAKTLEKALAKARRHASGYGEAACVRKADAEAPCMTTRGAMVEALNGGGGKNGYYLRHQMITDSALRPSR